MKKNSFLLIVIISLFFISCKNVKSNDNDSLSANSTFLNDIIDTTGNWEVFDVDDEFGDKTQEKYLGAKGKDSVQVDANRDLDMTVYLFIRKGELFFKFHLEDMQYVCHDNYPITMNIKDSKGAVHHYNFICKNNGEICINIDNDQSKNEFISILEKGGILSGSTQIYNSLYRFKINVSGYKEALTIIRK